MRLPSTIGAASGALWRRARAGAARTIEAGTAAAAAAPEVRAGARTDVQHHIGNGAVGEFADQLLDPRQRVVAQPLDHIAIRREQPELPVALDRLQGPHPGIELLHRELALEHAQTAIP